MGLYPPTRCRNPRVSEWGMIALTVLLLTAGAVVVGRRRRPAAA
ncbi:MAG: hypothetical protein IID36_13770 [Planctomycetes bacterium]|nr:hypothetical protein [Planctomycetota bacterium]